MPRTAAMQIRSLGAQINNSTKRCHGHQTSILPSNHYPKKLKENKNLAFKSQTKTKQEKKKTKDSLFSNDIPFLLKN